MEGTGDAGLRTQTQNPGRVFSKTSLTSGCNVDFGTTLTTRETPIGPGANLELAGSLVCNVLPILLHLSGRPSVGLDKTECLYIFRRPSPPNYEVRKAATSASLTPRGSRIVPTPGPRASARVTRRVLRY